MSTDTFVIVGGGIAGASVAYHLATETDASVTVYERGALAGETTAKSAAFFGFYGGDVQYQMKRYGMALYNDFFADSDEDLYYDLVGRFRIATSEATARELERDVGSDGDRPATAAEYLTPADVRALTLLPELDTDGLVGATYRPHVGYLEPRAIAREFADRARERGVTFRTETPVNDVLCEEGRVTGVVAGGQRHAAAEVICAAGPWNVVLARSIGLDLPVRHTLAPILKLRPEADLGHTLPIVTHLDSSVYVRGHRDGTVLVGHQPESYDDATEYDPDAVSGSVPADVREKMLATVADLFPALSNADVADQWVGVRSMTPDGHPIVGRTAVDGLSIAAFHSSGIQLSPDVGRIIAGQLVRDEVPPYYDALSPARFDPAGTDRRSE